MWASSGCQPVDRSAKMTKDNRRAVYQANKGQRSVGVVKRVQREHDENVYDASLRYLARQVGVDPESKGGRLSRKEAEEDLDQLEWLIENRFAYRDRRQKKRQFRRLWIARINAAARLNEMSYSTLMHGLKVAGVDLDRPDIEGISTGEHAE